MLGAIAAAFTLGFTVALLVLRRPPRRCLNCATALPSHCDEQAACNRRRDARELDRVGT